MKVIMVICILIFTSSVQAAADISQSDKYYHNFLTQKLIADFRAGIKHYNESKTESAPAIKRGLKQNYVMIVKNTRVHFSIVNYLNDQMYVNGKIVQRSTFGQLKTTWYLPFISEAVASEGDIDGDTTRIILTALGDLTSKLEEIGMLCFVGCANDIKKNNRVKIYNTLEKQTVDCQEQLETQSDSIKKYPSYQMVSLLHSTFNPEFSGVKTLIQKISETNIKKIKEFMTNKMIVNKNYQTCIEVITSGTVADKSYSTLEKMAIGGIHSSIVEEEIVKAQQVCMKMEELQLCLNTIKKNLNSINSIKRKMSKDGYNYPQETLPETKGIER